MAFSTTDARNLRGAEETIWTAAGVLRSWIEQYGVPVALYTDWKTVYVKEADAIRSKRLFSTKTPPRLCRFESCLPTQTFFDFELSCDFG